MPVDAAQPFDGNDNCHLFAASAKCVPPKTGEVYMKIGDRGGGVKLDPMVWISNREETAAMLADAASGEVAEAVGGVVYIFGQEEGAEKVKATVSSLGPTNPPNLRRVKLEAAIKEYHQ